MPLTRVQTIDLFLQRSRALPATLFATYLSGSQVDGSAVAWSDTDLLVQDDPGTLGALRGG